MRHLRSTSRGEWEQDQEANEDRAGDRRNSEEGRRRISLRLSGQPSDRGLRRGRHPPDHRAPGAHRPAHGRRHVAPDQGPQDGRVLHAERPGLGERLWRRRPGVRRIGAAAGHPGRAIRAASRTCRPTSTRRSTMAHVAKHAEPITIGQGDRQHHAPGLQPAAQRPRLAGDHRAAGRRLRRGRARSADLRAGGRHQVRPRSGRGEARPPRC